MTRRNNSGEVPAGHPRGLLRAGVLLGISLGLLVAGCGGGDASGARVTVYVGAPLCQGAKAELASHGAQAGHFELSVRCLAPTERTGGGLDLATNGSNSRRATEDTSSVATLESPNPGNKFASSILESAGVPLVISTSGQKGMASIMTAVESAGSSEVRDKVREVLEPS
jgi:hypothetical protein